MKNKDTDLIIQARWELKRRYNTDIKLNRDGWTVKNSIPKVAKPEPWPEGVADKIMSKIYNI